MFDIERKEIKVKLAMNTEIASKAIVEMKRLIEKAANLKEKYEAQIEKWRAKLNLFLVVRLIFTNGLSAILCYFLFS